jgi:hypothetical protein
MPLRVTGWLLGVAVALAAGPLWAQAARPATAVQLPTFSFFTASTTVSVPDGGSASLGGVDRSQQGRSEFGVPMLPFRPFRNTSIGGSNSASSQRVFVTIHDFEAMDEALLGQSAESFAQTHRPGGMAGDALGGQSRAALAGNWLPRSGQQPPAEDAAQAEARRVAHENIRSDEAERFFAQARQAEADGKLNVARIYYQMAARRATGELKEQALARIEKIQGAAATKLVQSRPQ